MSLAAGSKSKAMLGKGQAKLGPAASARRPSSYDNSIEGNLKQLLDDQSFNELSKQVLLEEEQAEVDAPLVRLVNSLLLEAIKVNASDIHIEPFESLLRVRLRIDGVLQEIQKIPHKLAPAIASRLKIMAGLDICERRIPQDGVIHFKGEKEEADLRLSTLPATYGENLVLRVMGRTNVKNDLSRVGIPDKQLKIIREAIQKPDGLVLVTGPTGSGKTTTLYAALNELNDISVSVFTAEDPVEGDLPGVTQAQVNASVGYTFAAILRSFLRQDPDVILVGEIRDQETAEISIKAALTGHLVLSTLHTNCAASTISRLINMGIAPYLLTSSINCIVAQRLVRRICDKCRQSITLPPEALEKLGSSARFLSDGKVFAGKGCNDCRGSGYKGRAPIYEVLSLSDELRRIILRGDSKDEIKDAARLEGMTTLREAGLTLVKDGVTTLEEVLSATNDDPELGESSRQRAISSAQSAVAPASGKLSAAPPASPHNFPQQLLPQPHHSTQPAAEQAVNMEDLLRRLGPGSADLSAAATASIQEVAAAAQSGTVQAEEPVGAARWKNLRNKSLDS